jgi:hypothetical protein
VSRWVCMRCFEANDDALAACQKCGLLRGATPAAGEQWAAPAQPASARTGAGRILPLVLRFWWVILLVSVPVAGFFINAQRGSEGEITRSGSLAITDLRVGDCFDLQDASADQVQDVIARPCGESHQYELIHVGSMPSGAYPNDAVMAAWLGGNCVPAFEAYLGITYDLSRYDISWFQPTADGWDKGDRSVQCAVVDPTQDRFTGSLRNAAR